MPLDMAMQQPDARVVRHEAQHHEAHLRHLHRVAAHGHLARRGVVHGRRQQRGKGGVGVGAGREGLDGGRLGEDVGRGAGDDLHGVAVQVEGVRAAVEVVEPDLDRGVRGQDGGIGVRAVDARVGGQVGGRGQGGEEGGHKGRDVGAVVHDGDVLAARLGEGEGVGNDGGRGREEGLLVVGDEVEVVEVGIGRVGGGDSERGGEGRVRIVDEVAGDAGAEIAGKGVEHVEVEGGDEGVVLGRGGLRGDEHTVALRGRDVEAVHGLRLGIDPVDLDDGHGVLVEMHVRGREGGHADHAHEVRLARLEGELNVLRVVDQVGVGDRLVAGRVQRRGEVGAEHGGELLVVPVREAEDNLLVVFAGVGGVRVVDDERAAQAVGVLPAHVGVVPVGAGLVDLWRIVSD